MKPFYTVLAAIVCFCPSAFSQSDCLSAIPVCGNTTVLNPSGVGTKLEQLACAGIEHNSTWLTFQAKANGRLNFVIRPLTRTGLPTNTDFNWSLYLLPGAPGIGNCDAKTQLSCNSNAAATVFGIPGATGMASPPYVSPAFNPGIDVVSGNWYALMVDQVSTASQFSFVVQFTGNPESANLNSIPAIFDTRPDFTINTTNGCSGAYSFTNSSTAVSGIASYLWDFGDGGTSTGVNPTHSFVTTGTYYVTLTITDNNGCQSTIRKQITHNNTAPAVNAAGLFVTPSCSDSNNGTLTVTTAGATTPGVTGGTAPYTYELISPSPVIVPSQTSNEFTGLQPGGYTVKVTDACGKSATGTATVGQVAGNTTIGLGIQNIQSACTGLATGSATIFANGTVPPYTMALVNSSPVLVAPQTALIRDPITSTYYVSFTNLLPGVYTVDATDACGRVRRATFTVTPSTNPVATTVASVSCAGTATGTLTVTATAASGLSGAGAPGVFQYALIAPSTVNRPFQYSSVFENLPPGAYTVAVKDTCGNIGTTTATIGTAGAPTLAPALTTLSCQNASTGKLQAQIATAGGGSPYTFELIAPSPVSRPAQSGNLFSSLPPGAYTVRVTDVCNSQVTGTTTVSAAQAPSFTTASTASCASPGSGTLTITPNASNAGPFSFELISPGVATRPVQGSNVANSMNSIFTGLAAGTYSVRMTDGCSVPVTATATIASPTALAFPAGTVTVPSCASSSTGRITVAVPTTGLGAYRYELIAPSPVTAPPQYSRIFDNVPAGSYTIRITDSCGTQIDNSASPVNVSTATAPTLSATNSSSCVTNTGTITALSTTANQGGGNYLFALIAPSPVTRPNQTAPIFTGLPAGAYTVQITDQCGATGTAITNITAAGAFAPTAGGSVVSCNGATYNGQIIVTTPQNFTPGGPIPTGSGGGPYTFALYDATNTTLIAGPQSSNVFTVVVPVTGTPTHTIRVTDVCGNTSTVAVTINNPVAVTNATISATTASCAASATGVIRVTGTGAGGLPPYTYSLINAANSAVVAGPQSSIVFNEVPANATGYYVRLTDACGNSTTTSTPLLFPAAVTPTATTATVASCATPATGRITVTPGTGATLAGGTFTYALYDAANTVQIAGSQSSPVFTGVAPGTYTVRITDRCGITGTASATVASGVAALTASGSASGTCTGTSTGAVTGSFTGGSLPVSYSLVDQVSSTVIAGPQSDNVFTGLASGTYIVRVTDACGTVANSSNIVLGNLSATPAITTSLAIDCGGSATIGGSGSGGNGGPFTYAICNGAGCTTFGAFGTASTFTVITSGTYRIATQDRCGNQVSSSDITVTIPVKPVMTGIVKANNCGATTITPSYTNIPNTAYFSLDAGPYTTTLGTIAPGCHSLRVVNFNAGLFDCASDPFEFSIFDAPLLTVATPANWSVSCGSGNVTPALAPGTGSAGCVASGASLGVELTACTGCNVSADAAGTIKAGGVAFFIPGATAATFTPVVIQSSSVICSSAPVVVDFTATPFNCTALPVTLINFSGAREGIVNHLRWSTASEQNNKGFTVQRSTDGVNFIDIGFVKSAAPGGSSVTELSYTFTDDAYSGTRQFYRLRQVDIDERSTLSATVVITGKRPVALSIAGLFPNPADQYLNVIVDAPETSRIALQVTDMTGRVIMQQAAGVGAGSNTIRLNIYKLASGMYLVKLSGELYGQRPVMKFIKQ